VFGSLIDRSLKTSTLKNYNSSLRQYTQFCKQWPPELLWTEASGCAWLLDCIDNRGLAKATVEGKLAAFQYGLMRYGRQEHKADRDRRSAGEWSAPVPPLKLMRKVVSKMPDKTVRKHPVGLKELERIFPTLIHTVSASQQQQAWLWWLISYAAMLRCSETESMLWSGVQFEMADQLTPGSMRITLLVGEDNDSTFKTHANSMAFHLTAQQHKHPSLCPVLMLWHWYQSSAQRGWPSGDKVFSLSVDQARTLFKEAAAVGLNMPAADFGLHSLRAGAATDAEEMGFTMSQIMFQGRWRSATMLVYLRNGQKMAQELGVRAPKGVSLRSTLFSQQHNL
jgi:hypothetical protein